MEQASPSRDEAEPHKPAKHSRSALAGQLGTVAACLSALIAVYAAYSSVTQVEIAKRQNEVSDRQSLATLVSEMAQQSRALTTADAQQGDAINQTLQADAEQALTLTDTLKGHIPAVDYYEIGGAFERVGEDYEALRFFKLAAQARRSPHYRASSLRGEAKILYALGGPADDRRARTDISLAYHAYDDQPDATKFQIENIEAFTQLFDVEQEAPSDCPQARTDLQQGKHLTEAHPTIVTASVSAVLKGAEQAVERCG